MVRVAELEAAITFYRDVVGLIEIRRYENETGRFTNVFFAAPGDTNRAVKDSAPLLELTYNWPSEDGVKETYTSGRNFGHLAYEVDDIYAYCTALTQKGVTINRPPRDGQMAFFKSPENISIEILQAGEALEPIEPWVSQKNVGVW